MYEPGGEVKTPLGKDRYLEFDRNNETCTVEMDLTYPVLFAAKDVIVKEGLRWLA